uniref:Ig-like domain-containing protein n=1 Tax=Haemonchus contortus TaxID=6289 RepID=A0A7I4YSJ7_HAECO
MGTHMRKIITPVPVNPESSNLVGLPKAGWEHIWSEENEKEAPFPPKSPKKISRTQKRLTQSLALQKLGAEDDGLTQENPAEKSHGEQGSEVRCDDAESAPEDHDVKAECADVFQTKDAPAVEIEFKKSSNNSSVDHVKGISTAITTSFNECSINVEFSKKGKSLRVGRRLKHNSLCKDVLTRDMTALREFAGLSGDAGVPCSTTNESNREKSSMRTRGSENLLLSTRSGSKPYPGVMTTTRTDQSEDTMREDRRTVEKTSFSERTAEAEICKTGDTQDDNIEKVAVMKVNSSTSVSERSTKANLNARGNHSDASAEKFIEEKPVDSTSFIDRSTKTKLISKGSRQDEKAAKTIYKRTSDSTCYSERSSSSEMMRRGDRQIENVEKTVGENVNVSTSFSEQSARTKLGATSDGRNVSIGKTVDGKTTDSTSFSECSAKPETFKADKSEHDDVEKTVGEKAIDCTSFSDRAAKARLTSEGRRQEFSAEKTVEEKAAENTSLSQRSATVKLTSKENRQELNAGKAFDEKTADSASFSEHSAKAKTLRADQKESDKVGKTVDEKPAESTSFSERSAKAKLTSKKGRQEFTAEKTFDEKTADSMSFAERSAKAETIKSDQIEHDKVERTADEKAAENTSFSERSTKAKLTSERSRGNLGAEKTVDDRTAVSTSFSERSAKAKTFKTDRSEHDGVVKAIDEKAADSTSFSERSAKARTFKTDQSEHDGVEKAIDEKAADSTSFSERSTKAKLTSEKSRGNLGVEKTVDDRTADSTSFSERSAKAKTFKTDRSEHDGVEKAIDEKAADSTSFSERSAKARTFKTDESEHYGVEKTVDERAAENLSFSERSTKAKLTTKEHLQKFTAEKTVDERAADSTSFSERSAKARTFKTDQSEHDGVVQTVDEKAADSTSFSERSTKAKLTSERSRGNLGVEKTVDDRTAVSTSFSERSAEGKTFKTDQSEHDGVVQTVDEKAADSTSFSERSAKARTFKTDQSEHDGVVQTVDKKAADSTSFSERSAKARTFKTDQSEHDGVVQTVDKKAADSTSFSERSAKARTFKTDQSEHDGVVQTVDEKAADSTSFSERSTKAKLTSERSRGNLGVEKTVDDRTADSTSFSERSAKVKTFKTDRSEHDGVEKAIDEKAADSTSFSERSAKAKTFKTDQSEQDNVGKTVEERAAENLSFSERSTKAKLTSKEHRQKFTAETTVDENAAGSTSFSERTVKARLTSEGRPQDFRAEKTIDENAATSLSQRFTTANLTSKDSCQEFNAEKTVDEKAANSTKFSERSVKAKLTSTNNHQDISADKAVEEKAADNTSFSELSARAKVYKVMADKYSGAEKTLGKRSVEGTNSSERSVKADLVRESDRQNDKAEKSVEQINDGPIFSERSAQAGISGNEYVQDVSKEEISGDRATDSTQLTEQFVETQLSETGFGKREEVDIAVGKSTVEKTSFSERAKKVKPISKRGRHDVNEEKSANNTKFSAQTAGAKISREDDISDNIAETTVDSTGEECMEATKFAGQDIYAENAVRRGQTGSHSLCEQSTEAEILQTREEPDIKVEKVFIEGTSDGISYGEQYADVTLASAKVLQRDSERVFNGTISTTLSSQFSNIQLHKPDGEEEATDTTASQVADYQEYSELNKEAFFLSQTEEKHFEGALKENATDQVAFSECTSSSYITKSSKQENAPFLGAPAAMRDVGGVWAIKEKTKQSEEKRAIAARSEAAPIEKGSVGFNIEVGDIGNAIQKISNLSELLDTDSANPTSMSRAVSNMMNCSSHSFIPPMSTIFTEEEGSATDCEECSFAILSLPLSTTVKVAETFAVAVSEPQLLSPAQSRSGFSEEKGSGSEATVLNEEELGQVQGSSHQKRLPAGKSKPSNIKYLSDETEKLLKKKAKHSERANRSSELMDSENDFGNQSTDQMADLGTDSDLAAGLSDNDVTSRRISNVMAAPEATAEALNNSNAHENETNHRAPVFRIKKQLVKCAEGKPLSLRTFISASPEPTLSVYHNDDLICANRAESLVKEGDNLYSFTFSVESLRVEDGGKLTIKAKNHLGSDECVTYIDVAEEARQRFSKFDFNNFEREFEAAEITTSIADVAVVKGETARLHGKVSGYPIPEMIWLKNGVEFNPMSMLDKYNVDILPDGTFTMEIADCNLDDDDVYALLVENMAGIDSCDFQVFVSNPVGDSKERGHRKKALRSLNRNEVVSSDNEIENRIQKKRRRIRKVVERANPNAPRLTQRLVPPHFEKILSDQDATEGEKVVMMVTMEGNPPPEVRFYRDGKLICDDDKYEIRHETHPISKHSLIVKNAEKTEEAEYACQAVNPAGEAWCYSDLTVRPTGRTEKISTDDQSEVETPITDLLTPEEPKLSKEVTEACEVEQGNRADTLQQCGLEEMGAKASTRRGKQKKQSKDEPQQGLLDRRWGDPEATTSVEGRKGKQSAANELEGSLPQTNAGQRRESRSIEKAGDVGDGEPDSKNVMNLIKHGPPSPDTTGKKKKNIPKALLIPSQISSRFGDPSILHSEASVTKSIKAPDKSAEVTSPIKRPQSANISVKIHSTSRSRSASGARSEGEFSFDLRSGTTKKNVVRNEASATLKLQPESKNQTGLPPKHVKKDVKKEGKGEKPKVASEINNVELIPSEILGQVGTKEDIYSHQDRKYKENEVQYSEKEKSAVAKYVEEKERNRLKG